MKRLDVYVLRELFVPFLIGTVMIVLMFQANTYMALARDLQLENVPFVAVLQLLIAQTPQYISMTLPLGMALSTSLAMSRISRESELTAVRAAGVPIRRVMLPIFVFGLAISAFHFYDVEVLLPPAMKRADVLASKIGGLGLAPSFTTNKLINIGRYAASFGSVQRTGKTLDMDLTSVLLIEHPDSENISLIMAKRGTYRSGIWTFKDPFFYLVHGVDVQAAHAMKDLTVNEAIDLDTMFMAPKPDNMSIAELREGIKRGYAEGGSVRQLQHALYDKFAVPFSCLIFAFVSPLFAVRFAKSGAFAGVLLSFVMALAYYNVYIVCSQILMKIATFPPLLSSALPDVLFLGLGIWASGRLE